ncbi:IS630 family transposase [bacterium]|nr:IS630 family transposase [bacterium]
MLSQAENRGDLNTAKRVMAILAVVGGNTYSKIASILKVCEESIRLWVKAFLLKGLEGLKSKKIPGRPPGLTKSQKKKLDKIITEGPTAAGFPGACWRSPMIQSLIYERFGIFYSVNYISYLLKNMGFSYQKAKFVSDHKDPEKRKKWLEEEWSEILKLAKEKNAHILFGDEASFPQWGSLSYTWAKKGQQPVVKTSGTRKGYKVLGLIDYFTGRFLSKGHEGRLNSEIYALFLEEVLSKTTKHIILIQDGARYHTSNAMKKFFAKHSDRITVYRLPSYSPDYNPIEKLWKKIKEKEVHLHYFPTFESLKNKVQEALLRFHNLKEEVLSLFGFYRELAKA